MYSEQVLDHFRNPRHVGEVTAPDGAGEAINEACGDRLRFTIRLEGDCVRELRFRAVGCAATIAAGSAIAEWAIDRTTSEALAITAEQVERELLGGLPGGKRHAASMAVDALRRAIAEHRTRPRRSSP